MSQTYVTVTYVPGMEQGDHGVLQQCLEVRVVDGTLRIWSNEHSYNPVEYRSIPLVHIIDYKVKEYR